MRAERAIAVVEQNAHGIGEGVARDEIWFTVAVEVSACHILRQMSGGIFGGNKKLLGPSAQSAQQ